MLASLADAPLVDRDLVYEPKYDGIRAIAEIAARGGENGWEGLIAKAASSRYVSGKRSPDWRKLKLLQEQEFVVAGWSEPRKSRTHFGALILGVYERGELRYVGHVGTGFDSKELERVMALLTPLETRTSPFRQKVPKNETPHWV